MGLKTLSLTLCVLFWFQRSLAASGEVWTLMERLCAVGLGGTAAWEGQGAGRGRHVANQTALLDVQLFPLVLPQQVPIPFLCLVPGNSLSLHPFQGHPLIALLPTSHAHLVLSFCLLSLFLAHPL